ncbi:hypothetical protein K503DRAFT_803498 [Rhizopogon vinicolor AM-OR11-026]|uniref:Uncharacterized protein n=1 Tax=Rhizopogon vinicolor AM-OR11-026 TaxID=1314800 RepID=A0A1B7MPL1_9AGAM|nr:hypothetical protein K503DRAFT_803498 [Rhizopogon vinicolor AM-OR11-026]
MDIKQQWTLKDLGQGFVTIGMPAIGGGFDYVWDLPEDCSGKSVVINAPTIADTQSWSFQLAG